VYRAKQPQRGQCGSPFVGDKKHGLEETEASIANKLSRGTFAATFFLASLAAIGCEIVNIEDI
jgi:Domain of unknown function (DUF6471)